MDDSWKEVFNTVKTLEPAKLAIVKATLPTVLEHGEEITKRFYQRLLGNHPELKDLFNQTHQKIGHQPKALANAVYAAAANIENLSAIMPALEHIGYKHKSLNIKPEQYPIVGENLLQAIKEILGSAATEEVLDAWAAAYEVIADAFIRMEDKMYKTTESAPGGWAGFRDFVVDKKVPESSIITSFYLKPADGKAIASYLPGQYTTVNVEIEGEEYRHNLRQYSLSDRPGTGYYRISVKREDPREEGYPPGVVSTFLHKHVKEGDIIPISAPSGDFYLDMDKQIPVALISAGVGLTPMLSMLNTLVAEQPDRKVYYTHAAINSSVHAMNDHVKQVAKNHSNVKSFVIYQSPTEADKAAQNYDKEGFITLEWMQSVLPKEADFYFCGPVPFMKEVNKALKKWGVPVERIHYEFFGTGGDLED
ncbi:NO-inducible flavohemoprotein [Aneurinibacillus sp. Ricciae_BoGa-3]|uniref:NO-inducible flavohemoprotein n=1 Tax=Aneurinibacillus sp. Ricciae_BoGa-3 TaxID=3022697 RepID=UPI002341BB85|nr:NO-inducible flavohemoprotein [Aneurinibacillus sp. Ricciae_BoGa-3]WCK56802.1 NO-inducible flavohemoprotein [Aneurinibacillus sp. Ricciae_BoGa-3]